LREPPSLRRRRPKSTAFTRDQDRDQVDEKVTDEDLTWIKQMAWIISRPNGKDRGTYDNSSHQEAYRSDGAQGLGNFE
jgi:hypothetical protein